MAEEANKRYAVVTGANKGIGFEICRQLASVGITVVLTSRNEKRGLEALQKFKDTGLSDYLVFHQLDVTDTASIAALADFIKTHFGKLDILVNNAGVGGVTLDGDASKASVSDFVKEGVTTDRIEWDKILTESAKLAEECIAINYYGAKRTTDVLIPLIHLSDSPRIVNVSSSMGKVKNVKNEWAKQVLDDALSEERIDEVLTKYLNDFKENSLESKGWPAFMSAYIISKAAMNAYTRILAKKLPSFRVNCGCPGNVKTDMNFNTGILSVEEGAESPVRLALLPEDGPSGCFFDRSEKSPF